MLLIRGSGVCLVVFNMVFFWVWFLCMSLNKKGVNKGDLGKSYKMIRGLKDMI